MHERLSAVPQDPGMTASKNVSDHGDNWNLRHLQRYSKSWVLLMWYTRTLPMSLESGAQAGQT